MADAVVRFLPEDATSPTETGGGRSSGVVGVAARARRDVPVASALPSDPTRLADAGVFAVAAADDSPPDRGVDPTSPDTTLLVDTLGRPPEAPTTSGPGPGDRDAAALLHRSSSAMDASLRGAMSPPSRPSLCGGQVPRTRSSVVALTGWSWCSADPPLPKLRTAAPQTLVRASRAYL